MAPPEKRSVLITGCSQGGSGHALALEFAKQGMRVFATARSAKSLAGLEEKGIETLILDVTRAESISALKTEIMNRTGGKLDILFNNAGSMYEAPSIEADPAAIKNMFNANVFGLFDMVAAFAPFLIAAVGDSGHPPVIVNTASIVARIPYPFSAAYSASKAAVAAYSDTLRLELNPLGVKVVTVFMGQVSTGITSPTSLNLGSDSLYTAAEDGIRARSQEHVDKSMKPDEFAKLVVGDLLHTPSLGKGERIWRGTNAFVIWALTTFGPRKVIDGIVQTSVGLTQDVKKAIFERGHSGNKGSN